MKDQIIELIQYIAPLAAGFVASILIPFLIKRVSVKRLKDKIDEINSGKQLEEINTKLTKIENEILEMRGKRQ